MSEPTDRTGHQPGPTMPDEIRDDIERTRAELADTVDELADKLNVKSQVGSIAHQVNQKTEGQRGKIAGGVAAAVVALFVARRLRNRKSKGKGKK